jgi:hypothetical protein
MTRVLVVASVLALAACGQNDDPAGATDLYDRIHQGAGYRAWQRAPQFPYRKPSFTDHSDAVEIFVDPNMQKALAGPEPVTRWPVGSIIVKESYADSTRVALAVMEKKSDGSWFWAEYNADGKALYSGKPEECIDCHNNRQGYSDWVYGIELPR